MKNILRVIFLIVSLQLILNASERIYFLPEEAKEVKSKIIQLIKDSKESVDIAMYSIDDKSFAKALKKAAKNGVEVTVIYGKSKLKFHKKINLLTTKRKQHIKLAIIDKKIAIYGSANWKKESFGENYEIINITDDMQKVEKFNEIMKQLKKEN